MNVDLVQVAKDRFVSRFDCEADIAVAAPGRVNLIGEHVDYNDGFVLPAAIERWVVIVAKRATQPTDCAQVFSLAGEQSATINLSSVTKAAGNDWSNYLRGVIAGVQDLGRRVPAFHAVIASDIPPGGGLSSSAALEVATATLLEQLTSQTLDPVQKALLCQHAENTFAGVPCGIMDQFASVLAKRNCALLLDCRSKEIEHIPMSDESVSILITNTHVKHDLSEGAYATRQDECAAARRFLRVDSLREVSLEQLDEHRNVMPDVIFRRARHIVTEISRTLEMADAMRTNDRARAGELMNASHRSLRDDYEVSCAELNVLVEAAWKIGAAGGVWGSRMTGGGFGGCTVSLVQTDCVAAISEKLRETYFRHTNIHPDIFATRPTDGAYVIST